ncbi:hypothetical protein DACRYDRAFT_107340 [Dacryopinax primogenitus]|uniref:Uncharacterized protein n=1 Tax=Dacryopinax primogenitus (strain DJM 731) TaxID=1858805 RepID=M5G978_DACPD|nr:uncharacterized protein DACRYDRAFT_107340 [Dacryopinax primogenitus]EJU02422.1 hypothetical protein DACRYDRAFT_107340 [Dacryopinax primogenitus]
MADAVMHTSAAPALTVPSDNGSTSTDTIKAEEPEPEKRLCPKEHIDIEQPFKTLNAIPTIVEPVKFLGAWKASVCADFGTQWERYRTSISTYEDQIAEQMLDLLLNVRAWSEARPTYEDVKGETDLRKRLDEIDKRQAQQGREALFQITRKNVFNFIDTVRKAIVNLTNIGNTLPV